MSNLKGIGKSNILRPRPVVNTIVDQNLMGGVSSAKVGKEGVSPSFEKPSSETQPNNMQSPRSP